MENGVGHASLFTALPVRERRRLADESRLRQFQRGQTVFEEGQRADVVWVVKRGWVCLVKRTPQGALTTIFVMTPDEALCGISAFDRGTYSAGAIAATDCTMLAIPAELFAHWLDTTPAFAKRVVMTCARRIRHMADAISLAHAPVEQRVAYVLLRLRATFGDTIPITHQELARMVGARWETSIRTLSAMKRRGCLASSRGQVTVLVPERLRALLRPRVV